MPGCALINANWVLMWPAAAHLIYCHGLQMFVLHRSLALVTCCGSWVPRLLLHMLLLLQQRLRLRRWLALVLVVVVALLF